MIAPSTAATLADLVLVSHVAIVLFVVGGLVAVLVGHGVRPRWRWVDGIVFRLAHLAAIGIVVAESWVGFECPLTTLERWLRVRAGAATYVGGFVEHWFHAVLFYDAPPWVFVAGYSLFGLVVVATWWRFPPTRRAARTGSVAAPRPGGPSPTGR